VKTLGNDKSVEYSTVYINKRNYFKPIGHCVLEEFFKIHWTCLGTWFSTGGYAV